MRVQKSVWMDRAIASNMKLMYRLSRERKEAMSRVLYIQASPRIQRSHSIAVADAFVGSYEQEHADDEIITVNLFEASIPNFDGLAVQAKYTILHGQPHSKEELQAWKNVDRAKEMAVSF